MSNQQELDDALVDTYRSLRKINEAAKEAPTRLPLKLGKGTPGRRLKHNRPTGESLRAFARRTARTPNHPKPSLVADAIAWMSVKRMKP